ncbi:MAG TPA: CAP domain-containing protein [Solirubrobacterales bacterium]|jgi:uncharacterized protein YkwD|nr:CAP domain-containing protein [Solirubrobacterales bacterium]
MARKLRRIALATITCAIFLAPATASASGPWDNLLAPESACPGQSNSSLPVAAQEQTMVCMHNWARTQKGLKALRPTKQLRSSSHRKAQDIMRCQQFSHEACGRNPFYWFRRVGFLRGSWGAGENLAFGQGNRGTVRGMMSAWLNSDVHRSVLLTSSFDDVGISVVDGKLKGRHGVAVWVAHFGYHH